MRKYSQKILVVVIVLTFFLPSVANGGAIMAFLNPLILKELVFDPIVKTLGTTFLNTTVKSMLENIKTGGIGKGSAVVFDWRQFLLNSEIKGENIFAIELKEALKQGGSGSRICDKHRKNMEFLFAGVNHADVKEDAFDKVSRFLNKTDITGFLQQIGCSSDFANKSADEIQKDLFTNENNAWDKLDDLFRPENTLGGIVFLSALELEKQKEINKEANKSEAQAGGGFLSKRPGGCIYDINGSTEAFDDTACIIKNTIGVPGSVLGDSTSEAIRSQLANLISADEIGELGSLLVSLVINSLLNSGTALTPNSPPLSEKVCTREEIEAGATDCTSVIGIPEPERKNPTNPSCKIVTVPGGVFSEVECENP